MNISVPQINLNNKEQIPKNDIHTKVNVSENVDYSNICILILHYFNNNKIKWYICYLFIGKK